MGIQISKFALLSLYFSIQQNVTQSKPPFVVSTLAKLYSIIKIMKEGEETLATTKYCFYCSARTAFPSWLVGAPLSSLKWLAPETRQHPQEQSQLISISRSYMYIRISRPFVHIHSVVHLSYALWVWNQIDLKSEPETTV